jgi:hypothetical protein
MDLMNLSQNHWLEFICCVVELLEKSERKRSVGSSRRRCEDNIIRIISSLLNYFNSKIHTEESNIIRS